MKYISTSEVEALAMLWEKAGAESDDDSISKLDAADNLRTLLSSAVELPGPRGDCSTAKEVREKASVVVAMHLDPDPSDNIEAAIEDLADVITADAQYRLARPAVDGTFLPVVEDRSGEIEFVDDPAVELPGTEEEPGNWPTTSYDPSCYWCRRFAHKELAGITNHNLCHRHAMMELESLRHARLTLDDQLREAWAWLRGAWDWLDKHKGTGPKQYADQIEQYLERCGTIASLHSKARAALRKEGV